jgi:hypothetical protein
MIGFNSTSVTLSLSWLQLIWYSAIADLHNLQFTVAHALGSSVFTSRVLATELKHRNCKSLTELHIPNITHKFSLYSRTLATKFYLHSRQYRTELSTVFHDGFVSLTHGSSAATTRKLPLLAPINLRHGSRIENTFYYCRRIYSSVA